MKPEEASPRALSSQSRNSSRTHLTATNTPPARIMRDAWPDEESAESVYAEADSEHHSEHHSE
jgi:hypothetical protein